MKPWSIFLVTPLPKSKGNTKPASRKTEWAEQNDEDNLTEEQKPLRSLTRLNTGTIHFHFRRCIQGLRMRTVEKRPDHHQVTEMTYIPAYLMFLCFTALCLFTVSPNLNWEIWRHTQKWRKHKLGRILMELSEWQHKPRETFSADYLKVPTPVCCTEPKDLSRTPGKTCMQTDTESTYCIRCRNTHGTNLLFHWGRRRI